MSRYIDADALREKWLCLQGHDFSTSSFVYSIDNAPTVDAVPVKWIETYMDSLGANGLLFNAMIIEKLLRDYKKRADGERKDGEHGDLRNDE